MDGNGPTARSCHCDKCSLVDADCGRVVSRATWHRHQLPKRRRLGRGSALDDGGGPADVNDDGRGDGDRGGAAVLNDGNLVGDGETDDGGQGGVCVLDLGDGGQGGGDVRHGGDAGGDDVLGGDDVGGSGALDGAPHRASAATMSTMMRRSVAPRVPMGVPSTLSQILMSRVLRPIARLRGMNFFSPSMMMTSIMMLMLMRFHLQPPPQQLCR